MPYAAYMRIRLKGEYLKGQHTFCGEENLYKVLTYNHQIGGKEDFTFFNVNWNVHHTPLKTSLELCDLLPILYKTLPNASSRNQGILDRVEFFFPEPIEGGKREEIGLKISGFPAKVQCIGLEFPNIKDPEFERYGHLLSLEFRYKWIRVLRPKGHLQTDKYLWMDFEEAPKGISSEEWENMMASNSSGKALQAIENYQRQQRCNLVSPAWVHNDEVRKSESAKMVTEGDSITLSVQCSDFEENDEIEFTIVDSANSPKTVLGSVTGKNRQGKAEVEWQVDLSEVQSDAPKLAFSARCRGKSSADCPIKMAEASVICFSM